jgi:putative transposase
VWTQQGWLYLAVVIDLYSGKVVGWSMGRRLTAILVCEALQMALWRRLPPKGQLIHHSDRGVQYASEAFRKLLESHGIEGSMSRKGDCWDNAVVESFFGTFEVRAGPQAQLPDPRGSQSGHRRVHHDVLQQPTAAFLPGLPESR